MIHVDPAHPAFERLPREQQARIYHSMGWDIPALAEEFDVARITVRMWVNPEYREREKARLRAYRQTARYKQTASECSRRYRESGRRAEAKARAQQEAA